MTGTAVTVGEELREFYGLEVAVIPPNRPCVREDQADRVYATVGEGEADRRGDGRRARERAAGSDRHPRHRRVGTARRQPARPGPTCVLNAKNDAQEAAIIAEAGSYGAITVSTQMAGRGTDIRLGGGTQRDSERSPSSAGCT